MGQIEAVFSDLDGTLLNNDHAVSDYNNQIMDACWAANIPFYIITGRAPQSIRTISTLKPKNMVGCFNGCIVENFDNNQIMYEMGIDLADNQAIIDTAHKNNFTAIWYSGKKVYTNKDDALSQAYFHIGGLKPEICPFDEFAKTPLIKVVLKWHDEAKLDEAYTELTGQSNVNLWGTYSLANSLELLNKNANKGEAVKFIANHYGYNLKNCIAFGDNANDVPMLDIVGQPVVMANGRQSVVNQYNEVAETADNDGVGRYLQKRLRL
ncbi:MAG: HAD family hydrolase [Alphaproteobacteria bacterium]